MTKPVKIGTFIILVNFLIYIGLGLPDAIMGSAWPAVRQTYHVNVDYVGYLTMISLAFSFISTLLYPRLAKAMTMASIMLMSMGFVMIGILLLLWGEATILLILASVALGLGQGAIDIAVNDYAAKHFTSGLMSILHGRYGVGVTLSSLILAISLLFPTGWRIGVLIIGVLQLLIMLFVYQTRQEFAEKDNGSDTATETGGKLRGADWLLPIFYFFYSVELVVGKYLSSYAVDRLKLSDSLAANATTLFWAGLMVGRFLTGLTTKWFSNKQLILGHIVLTFGGMGLLFVPNTAVLLCSSFAIGLGLSALYPLMMMVPYERHDDQTAKLMVSRNLAFCQAGMVVLPLITGWVYQAAGATTMPLIGFILVAVMLGLTVKILK